MREQMEIIIIDDDPFTLAFTQKTIGRFVRKSKMRVFSGAKDALQYLLAAANPSDPSDLCQGLIFSDLHMPDMDGYEFLDEFARLPVTVQDRYKVYVLSSTSDQHEISLLYTKRYFEGFCSKPLSAEKLRYLLRKAIRRR